jgi:rhodanese-related sulfurtransferase
MASARTSIVAVLLGVAAGVGALVAFRGRSPAPAPRPSEDPEVRRLLEDRGRPWWNHHALPKENDPPKIKAAEAGEWGSMTYPPPGVPLMPPILAHALLTEPPSRFSGTQFQGRAVFLVDIRERSDFYLEHIAGSRSAPPRDMHRAATMFPKHALLIAVGNPYPHFDALAPLRAEYGSVYCLEGGLPGWRTQGFPIEGKPDAQEYRRLVEEERTIPGPIPGGEFQGLGPLALKTLQESKADLVLTFVGDQSTFEAGHIPGSIRVPLSDLEPSFREFSKDRSIVVYCGCCLGRAGGFSEIAARKLIGLGFRKVLHLDGHMQGWRAAGFPVDTGAPTK